MDNAIRNQGLGKRVFQKIDSSNDYTQDRMKVFSERGKCQRKASPLEIMQAAYPRRDFSGSFLFGG
jgi:hypothetical protein